MKSIERLLLVHLLFHDAMNQQNTRSINHTHMNTHSTAYSKTRTEQLQVEQPITHEGTIVHTEEICERQQL